MGCGGSKDSKDPELAKSNKQGNPILPAAKPAPAKVASPAPASAPKTGIDEDAALQSEMESGSALGKELSDACDAGKMITKLQKEQCMQNARDRNAAFFTMLAPSPPVDALEPQGWSHDEGGKITEGRPQSKGDSYAHFKHTRSLQPKDVWRMRVEVGGRAWVGFTTEQFNVEKHGETHENTARVSLYSGTTFIDTGISQDEEEHYHSDHLEDHIPEAPFDLAVRCEAVSNVPQIQFNDDDVWHDFAPDRAALKAGLWFPYLELANADVRLSDHSVHRPRAVKSAGKIHKAPAAAAADSADGADGAGACITSAE